MDAPSYPRGGECWRYRFPMEFDVFPVVLLPTFHQVLDQIDSVVEDTLSEGFARCLTSDLHDE